jgi:CitMHS family citrate-Mg2+:H+ or citrate-Ca2+:H+ symporter
MLPFLGLATIVVLLGAILSKRMSPLVALIIVPIAASLIGGFGFQTSKFVIDGLKNLAPVVGMFVFAILYFGIVTDAGTLDPIIDRILRAVGTRPTRIVMGTTLLALLIHLDGSGAVCFLVTIPAMLPLYDRLKMDRRVLAAAVSMAAGINFLPWTGPMIRASASLHLPISALFNPLIPVQLIGLVFVFGMAFWLGRREEKRLGLTAASPSLPMPKRELTPEEQALRRPKNFWFNIVLTLVVLGTMVVMGEKIPPAIMFMVGLCVALMVNYPNVDMQRKRIDAHARAALMMAGILLAAGVFTGVMQGSGMLKAMAQALRAARDGRPHSCRARVDVDAAEHAVRPGLVLLRCAAGDCRSGRPTRRARRACRPGCAAWPDDHRFSGQPADAGDFPRGRPVRHRSRRSSEIHVPPAVWRLDRDDDCLRRAGDILVVSFTVSLNGCDHHDSHST